MDPLVDPNLTVSVGDLIAFSQNRNAQKAARDFAERRSSQTSRESPFDTITVALDTAATEGNPYPINQPFRSIWCTLDTTDTTVTAKMFVNSRENTARVASLGKNVAYSFPELTSSAYLIFPSQPGKVLVLQLLREGQIFPGTQIQTQAGGVSITSGAAVTTTKVTALAATPTILFPLNPNRKTGTWVNDTGQTAYIGTAVVSNSGTNRGIPVPAGSTLTWRNPAAAYAYFSSAVAETAILEES